jgi:hypothetical protein
MLSSKYHDAFLGTICVLVLMQLAQRGYFGKTLAFGNKRDVRSNAQLASPGFVQLRRAYLVVYALMVAGDWLQGPHLYALYDSFGYSHTDIALLFVAGFGSSMVFGTFVGSLADRWGCKPLGVLYAAFYIASCSTKHFRSYKVLMLGRLLGGVSTSLLFSVFESWLVKQAHVRGLGDDAVSSILSTATLLNSFVAIVSGQVADLAVAAFPASVDDMATSTFVLGGYTAPFDVASAVLALGAAVLAATWTETQPTREGAVSTGGFSPRGVSPRDGAGNNMMAGINSARENLAAAISCLMTDRKVLLCGAIQSLFEGSMYSFVFMWTPAIRAQTPEGVTPPYGAIFGSFMVCSALGSQIFSMATGENVPVHTLLLVATMLGSVSLGAVLLDNQMGTSWTYVGFLVFEVCVGVFYPSMGTIKSRVVPEEMRTTLYNLFRVPLNIIVLAVLLGGFTMVNTFMTCCVLLFIAGTCTTKLVADVQVRDFTKLATNEHEDTV